MKINTILMTVLVTMVGFLSFMMGIKIHKTTSPPSQMKVVEDTWAVINHSPAKSIGGEMYEVQWSDGRNTHKAITSHQEIKIGDIVLVRNNHVIDWKPE